MVFLSHWHLWSNFKPVTTLELFLHEMGERFYAAAYAVTYPTGGHHPAVLCFFVLSGFCIHYPFEHRANLGANPDWKNYFRRRFWRIMPVYWTAGVLGLVFVATETLRPSGSSLLAFHVQTSFQDSLVRFVGVASLYPREIFVGNYILNTVASEIIMYLVYPFFFFFAARGSWKTLGWAFVLMHVFAVVLLRFVTPYWVYGSIFMLGIFWFFGAYAAHCLVARGARISGRWPLLCWLVFLGLKRVPYFYGVNLLIQLAWGMVCAVGILWIVGREVRDPEPKPGVLQSTLRFSSQISYSLYAVHTPAMMLATWALLVFTHQESYLAQLIATLAVSLAATLAVYYGVERIFYRPKT